MQRLTERGHDVDGLDDMRRLIDAPNSGIFDILDNVLGACEAHGVGERSPLKIANFLRMRQGSPNHAKRRLWSFTAINDAFIGIERRLYR